MIAILNLTLALTATALLSVNGYAATDYASGTGALETFDGAARSAAPLPLKLWLALLNLSFLAALFFVRKRPIARWALGGMIVAKLTGPPVFAALGLPMLSGSIALWHIVCWTPVLVLLLAAHPFLDRKQGHPYRVWSGVMTTVILISFVFDIRDAVIYLHHLST